MLNKLWMKVAVIGTVAAGVLFYLVIPFAIEWYIERNGEELTGRQIRMEDIDLNILTGGVTVEKLDVMEADKQSTFFQVDEIYVNVAVWQLFLGRFTLTEVTVQQPQITVVQQGAGFNFDDLMTRFMAVDTTQAPPEPEEPAKYRIENIGITGAVMAYQNRDLNSEIKIVQFNGSCPLISWDDPKELYAFDFRFDKGGKAKGTFLLDINSMVYRADYALDSMNIGIFFPYVTDYMRAGDLTGLFTSHQVVAGNFNKPTDVATSGLLRMNSFSLTDPKQDRLIALEEMNVVIDSVNIGNEIYDFKYVSMDRPYLKVELYEEGNNFSKLMKEAPAEGTGISSDSLSKAAAYGNVFALMAAYVREMSHLYAFSDYNADSLVLRRGTLVFNDFTLHNRFNYLLENLMVKTDKVSSSNANIKVEAASTLNHSGRLQGELLVDPHGFNNMTIDYSIRELKVSDFNPYSDYYVAHPFTDGICTYVSNSSVKNYYLKSDHVLDIKSIKVGKKTKNKTAYKIPVRLAVALLRDKNGDVHLELPIEGNLNDPKYKIGKVIWQVFRNLIGKVVASPGKLLAGKAGVDEKLLEGFDWKPLQSELDNQQLQSLDALVKSLESTPEMKVELTRVFNDPREMDELALQEGKKRFLFFRRKITSVDTIASHEQVIVDDVHPNDSTFNSYLNQQVNPQGEMISVYEKSRRLAGSERLRKQLLNIYRQRTEKVLAYLITAKGVSQERVTMVDPTTLPTVPYATDSRMTFRFFVDDN